MTLYVNDPRKDTDTILRADDQRVIHMPMGYGTALQALAPGSRLLVFADYGIEHSKEDDATFVRFLHFLSTHRAQPRHGCCNLL